MNMNFDKGTKLSQETQEQLAAPNGGIKYPERIFTFPMGATYDFVCNKIGEELGGIGNSSSLCRAYKLISLGGL